MQQEAQLFRILLIHNIEFVIQNAFDAMGSAVDPGNFLRVKSGTDHTVSTGVYDGSGAAGLAENTGTDKLFTHEMNALHK